MHVTTVQEKQIGGQTVTFFLNTLTTNRSKNIMRLANHVNLTDPLAYIGLAHQTQQ